MTQEEKLLSKASKHFTDKQSSCVCYPATIIHHLNGMNYILLSKEKAEVVSNIAINSIDNRDMTSAGQLDFGEYIIQTPRNLLELFKKEPEVFILKYQDNYFTVHSLMAYNEEAGHYSYRTEILQVRNKKYIILDISEIKENLLNNSIPIWLYNKERLGIPVYPSFLSPVNLDEPYLNVEVLDTKSLSMVRLGDKRLGQWKQDDIRLFLVNATTELQQEISYKIQMLSIEYNENVLGVNDIVNFKSAYDDRQKGFSIITNKAISDIRVNYYQETYTIEILENLIKHVILQVNNNTVDIGGLL